MFSDLAQRICVTLEVEELSKQLIGKFLEDITLEFIEKRLSDILPEEFPVNSSDVSSILTKLKSKITLATKCDLIPDDSNNSSISKLILSNQIREYLSPPTRYDIQLTGEILKKYEKLFKFYVTLNNDNSSTGLPFEDFKEIILSDLKQINSNFSFDSFEDKILSTEICIMNQIDTMKSEDEKYLLVFSDLKKAERLNKIRRILKQGYRKWRNNEFVKSWDSFWDKKTKLYLKDELNNSYSKIGEKVMKIDKAKKNPKKQKISKKITREVLKCFASISTKMREAPFKKIEEIVREHKDFNFAETTLRNWLNNNARYYKKMQNKTPAEIKDIITVNDAHEWYNNYLKAKNRL